MPPCELCGADTSDLQTVRVSCADLDVCESCSTLGTTLNEGSGDETPDTKYSTEPTDTADTATDADQMADHGQEMVDPLVPDYPTRITDAREQAQLTVAELADRLNEKASHLQKVERGEMQPSTTLQMQLEQFLNIDLTPETDDP